MLAWEAPGAGTSGAEGEEDEYEAGEDICRRARTRRARTRRARPYVGEGGRGGRGRVGGRGG